MSKYVVFSGLYFPVFGQNTEIYSVSLHIQSYDGKIWTWKNSLFGHFFDGVMTFTVEDKNSKLMSFCIDDEKLLKKYKAIWTKIEDLKNI